MVWQRLLLSASILGFLFIGNNAANAKGCHYKWAVPGQYTVTGNFRGTVESAGARLTRDCRVIFQVPGVFSGTKVKKAGGCLRFAFKVQNVKKKTFSAKWCNTYGIVPWNGRNIRASVKLVKRGQQGGAATQGQRNYNLKAN